ncbi:unnamed protein product, partial [Rotaria magnacalcarata]
MYYSIAQLAKATLTFGTTIYDVFEHKSVYGYLLRILKSYDTLEWKSLQVYDTIKDDDEFPNQLMY